MRVMEAEQILTDNFVYEESESIVQTAVDTSQKIKIK